MELLLFVRGFQSESCSRKFKMNTGSFSLKSAKDSPVFILHQNYYPT
ncbi:hypothetical protein BH10CYA1_BH10CYA1_44990 [soil metagenome]